jgi:hypothetical protein
VEALVLALAEAAEVAGALEASSPVLLPEHAPTTGSTTIINHAAFVVVTPSPLLLKDPAEIVRQQ